MTVVPRSNPLFKSSLARGSSRVYLEKLVFFALIIGFSFSTAASDKPFCKWGDCKNGLGEKVFPQSDGSERSYISTFRDGRRDGYTIRVTEKWVCEMEYQKGRSNGLRFCALKAGDQAVRYMQASKFKKGSPYFYKNSRGKLISVGRWMGSDNVWPELIDTRKITKELNALREKGKELEEFLPRWFPEKVNVPTESEMTTLVAQKLADERNDDPSISVAKEANTTSCRWGNCGSGVGEKIFHSDGSGDISYISKFEDGDPYGYAIRLDGKNNWVCEQFMENGEAVGIRFCATEKGAMAYRYLDGKTVRDSDYLFVSEKGRISFGQWQEPGKVVPAVVDLNQMYKDHKALRRKARSLESMLPAWFPKRIGVKELLTQKEMQDLVREKKQIAERSRQDTKNSSQVAVAKEAEIKSGCLFGDCVNGFGSYRWKSGTANTGFYTNRKQDGYSRLLFSSGTECEGNYKAGKRDGLVVCLNKTRAYANYYIQDEKLGAGIEWNPDSGQIRKLGVWNAGKFLREERIDLNRMSTDWDAIKSAVSPTIRTSFISDKFLALNLPLDSQSEWLRKRELARADKAQNIPEDASGKLGCLSGDCKGSSEESATRKSIKKIDRCADGDCKNGVGRYIWRDGNFTIANYVEGKREGYGVYSTKSGKTECERIYRANAGEGLSACKTTYRGEPRYQFNYLVNGELDKEDLFLITDKNGRVVTYTASSEDAVEDYERLTRDYAAMKYASRPEFRDQLSAAFRRIKLPTKAVFEADVILKSLNSSSKTTRTLDYEKAASDAYGAREHEKWLTEQGSTRSKKFSAPPKKKLSKKEKEEAIARATASYEAKKRAGELDTAERERPDNSKLEELLASHKERAGQIEAPNRTVKSANEPVSSRPRSDMQKLALIAAELNGGSRQINFNFRLERVRVEPAAYELIYEFFATKPIKELDTNIIKVANQTAYCSASKLQPFREAKMPARWVYVDSSDETIEMMTRESDC